MKKLLRELLPFKREVTLLAVTVVVASGANLALPMFLSRVINTAIPAGDMGAVLQCGGIMLFFVLTAAASSIGTGYFASRASVGAGRNLRSRVFRKIQFFSRSEFDQFSTSSLITRTNNDVVQVQNFLNMFLRITLMAPILAIGGIVLAFQKNAMMSLILLISMPVMIVAVVAIGKKAVPLSKKMQKELDRINLVIREKLTGVRVARTFGMEDFEEARFEEVNRSFMETAIRMNTVTALMMPALNFVLYGTTIALLMMGGVQIASGNDLLIGDVIAVIQYVSQIMLSVILMSVLFVIYPRTIVSFDRIDEVLNREPKIRSGEKKASDLRATVEFKNVSFSFPHADLPALKNISFRSRPGEVTAIIGSTGSGKSTLIQMIPRFYDAASGEVLVNGINVKDWELSSLREKIGYVPQKAFLFQGTIEENVGYGMKSAKSEEMEHALKIAQSYDFVSEREGGMGAEVEQGGANLSGGQRQRLSIARAIARRPEIYLFDDSFSALDFKTDAALRKALFQETKDATVLLVAQRVGTVRNADRILVLEYGACVGEGTHEELMKSCEVYREIVYSQLSKEEVAK